MQFTLAGATFRSPEDKAVLFALKIGSTVTLKPDPTNEYDSTAVRVIADGAFIGFVPAADNKELFERLNAGESISGTVIMFESKWKPVIEIDE